jgi:DNA-binding MarR family transcriptional regulator
MPEDRDLVAGVAQLANLLNRRLAPVLERAGITPQQWGVLTVIAASADAMTLAAVARKLGVSKQNMTGMIDRLMQIGLIDRLENPADLRSSRIQLTRRGQNVMEKFAADYEEWLSGLAPARDRQQLTLAINRLISRLEES